MAPEAVKAPEAEAKPKAEKQTNCLACNKPIKKIRRYYRDGKYYCTKRCWRAYLDKSKEAAKKE
ncbi:MAG: hypothetical protein WC561_01145 [Candidatus Omnitrophota bacterium]|jgi:hypothetical protein